MRERFLTRRQRRAGCNANPGTRALDDEGGPTTSKSAAMMSTTRPRVVRHGLESLIGRHQGCLVPASVRGVSEAELVGSVRQAALASGVSPFVVRRSRTRSPCDRCRSWSRSSDPEADLNQSSGSTVCWRTPPARLVAGRAGSEDRLHDLYRSHVPVPAGCAGRVGARPDHRTTPRGLFSSLLARRSPSAACLGDQRWKTAGAGRTSRRRSASTPDGRPARWRGSSRPTTAVGPPSRRPSASSRRC
jgi:hypothetical protein